MKREKRRVGQIQGNSLQSFINDLNVSHVIYKNMLLCDLTVNKSLQIVNALKLH